MAIRSSIYKRDRSWVFYILDYDDNIDAYVDTNALEDCIDWTQTHLERYPRAVRMAYDMWYFKSKKEAEKFQTLWMLKFSG